MKRKLCMIFAAIFIIGLLFTGCEKRSEIGKWHAEIKLIELGGNSTVMYKKLLESVGINPIVEIEAVFLSDGTFTYTINTEKVKNTLSEFSSSVTGLLGSANLSEIVEELVNGALNKLTGLIKTDFSGTYTKNEEGLIIASDVISLYFRVQKGELHQLTLSGETLIVLTSV